METAGTFEKFASTTSIRDDLRRKSVTGAVFTAGGGAADFVLRLLSTLVLARLVTPEHFGLVGMVAAVTSIAEQFSSLGLSTATVQAKEITHRQCSNLFWLNAVAGATVAVFVAGLAGAIAHFYQDSRLVPITLAISSTFVFGGLTIQHEALLIRQMRQPQIAGNRLLASFISACVAIILAINGAGYWALVWREIIRALWIAIGVWILCPWIPALPSKNAGVRALVRVGRDMTLTNLLVAFVARLDSLLIGKFAGAVSLGLYRQAYQLMMVPLDQLNTPIMSVAQPGLSVLQTDPVRYRSYYYRVLFLVSAATMPLGVFSALYAKEIVEVVLGAKWLGAVVFLQIFAVAAAIRPAIATSGVVLVTCGRSRMYLTLAIIHSALLIVLMVAGLNWGTVGICLAQLSATVILLVPKLHYSFKDTPVTVAGFFRSVWQPFVASIAMLLGLIAFRLAVSIDHTLMSLIVGCGVAALLYTVALSLVPGGWMRLSSTFRDVAVSLKQQRGAQGFVA